MHENKLVSLFCRFAHVQAMDTPNDGVPRWVEMNLNIDDHIIIPRLDSAILAPGPEKGSGGLPGIIVNAPYGQVPPFVGLPFP